MPKAKKSAARTKKPNTRSKPSSRRRRPAAAGGRRAAAAAASPSASSLTDSPSVEFACSALNNDYPDAPAGLIQLLDGIPEISAGIARGRIVITVVPES